MVEAVGRVFVAVPLPPEIRLALADRLEGLDIPGKLVPPGNWHLTLRFLGEVERTTYEVFLSRLVAVEGIPSFRVSLDGIGGFPRPERASVVWAGLASGSLDSLSALNEIAEQAAETAGLAPEERPFKPHVSLSRVRPPESINHLSAIELGLSWLADRVVVYRSHLGGGPAHYEELETLMLAGG